MKTLLLTLKLLCVGDAGTSHYILASGGREVVYPVQNPYALDAIIAGQCYVGQKGLTTLYNRRDVVHGETVGHERLAKGLAITMIAVRGFAVYANTRAIVRHRE